MKQFAGIIAGSILANGMSIALAEDVVAAKHIRAGSIITATDIVTPIDRDALRRASKFIGLETSQTIYQGQPLDEDGLKQPTLVKRNAIVEMKISKGVLTIAAEGRALEKGAMGDRIRVMNLASKRVVTATISGPDNVRAKL